MNLLKICFSIVLIFLTFSCREEATKEELKPAPKELVEVSIPEVYELANIILAITDYGIQDPQEIHKGSLYYSEMLKYFEPYKNHPLIKKANYSRELWEDLLSFRTDAVAFEFDSSGLIKRNFEFYANPGHRPFDENLVLINDFAKKSNFRRFYKVHKSFYDRIISDYSAYYMIMEMKDFLDSIVGNENVIDATHGRYKIILSPFVGRMNCHRDLDSLTTADFPNVADALLQENTRQYINREEQAIEIHTIFTEMDHGYVNPISDEFTRKIEQKFDYKKWDKGSGYEGQDCFNEYMTWSLYDLFIEKYFPEFSKTTNIQWHYQNASRGFFASNFFADALKERIKGKNLKSVYPELLDWCNKVQNDLSLPVIVLEKQDKIYTYDKSKPLAIKFSEPIKQDFDTITIYASQYKNSKPTYEGKLLKLCPNDIKWKENTMLIKREIDYDEFTLSFNWWGIAPPILSKKGIMLSVNSYVNYKAKK